MTKHNDKVKRLKEMYGKDVDGVEVKRFSDLWTVALEHIMRDESLVRTFLSSAIESIVIAGEGVPVEVADDELVFKANWTPQASEAMQQEMHRYMNDMDVHTSECGCPRCITERMEKELGRKLDA